MSACGPAEEVDEGVERHGADWQGIKEPYQLDRAHAEYGRDQAMGSPCYPDEGCFLAMDGSVLSDDPNAYLGRVLKGRQRRGVPNDHV